MFNSGYFEGGEDPAAYLAMMQNRGMGGRPTRRFDEHYRCYPSVMLPGPDRDHVNFGGKIFMPPSALEKLTRLHIEYPMNFELINGAAGTVTHAGVLEFVAEEGKVYLPPWMMDTLAVEMGDILQIKSTSLAPAKLVKLQPQSTNFLDISDPKAVLEMAFRNFATLTQGDVFKFKYNDTIYEIQVLEVKPTSEKMGVSMLETDVEVDFAPPIGYVEPTPTSRSSGTSTPRNGLPAGGLVHNQGTMAQSINYDAIKPSATTAATGAKAASSNFLLGGQKLNSKKGAKGPTPQASTPVAGQSTNPPAAPVRRINGPQPLRLAPNKLFFGYDIKPFKTQADKDKENADAKQPHFAGQGQTLRGGVKRKGESEKPAEPVKPAEPSGGRRLDGRKV